MIIPREHGNVVAFLMILAFMAGCLVPTVIPEPEKPALWNTGTFPAPGKWAVIAYWVTVQGERMPAVRVAEAHSGLFFPILTPFSNNLDPVAPCPAPIGWAPWPAGN